MDFSFPLLDDEGPPQSQAFIRVVNLQSLSQGRHNTVISRSSLGPHLNDLRTGGDGCLILHHPFALRNVTIDASVKCDGMKFMHKRPLVELFSKRNLNTHLRSTCPRNVLLGEEIIQRHHSCNSKILFLFFLV